MSSPMSTAAPTCTIIFFKEPSFKTDCTFTQSTSTVTVYTDCGGCALETERLGVGLVSNMIKLASSSRILIQQ
jgi:hypothetical protein